MRKFLCLLGWHRKRKTSIEHLTNSPGYIETTRCAICDEILHEEIVR